MYNIKVHAFLNNIKIPLENILRTFTSSEVTFSNRVLMNIFFTINVSSIAVCTKLYMYGKCDLIVVLINHVVDDYIIIIYLHKIM